LFLKLAFWWIKKKKNYTEENWKPEFYCEDSRKLDQENDENSIFLTSRCSVELIEKDSTDIANCIKTFLGHNNCLKVIENLYMSKLLIIVKVTTNWN
jgi:hypothetical protein